MAILDDVTSFAVDTDCLFTWDSVTNATGYELRIGAAWATALPLVGVPVTDTSYQYTKVLDAETILIKAVAPGYTESANAASVVTAAAPVIADVTGVGITADEVVFDLVPSATSYEIRYSQGFADDSCCSQLLTVQADNTPFPVINHAGKRFYVRAYGPCNTKSDNYSSYFSEFDESGCSPVEPPSGLGGFLPKSIRIREITGNTIITDLNNGFLIRSTSGSPFTLDFQNISEGFNCFLLTRTAQAGDWSASTITVDNKNGHTQSSGDIGDFVSFISDADGQMICAGDTA